MEGAPRPTMGARPTWDPRTAAAPASTATRFPTVARTAAARRGARDPTRGCIHRCAPWIPPDGYTFVGRDTAVKVDVNLPNVGQGVAESTLTPANVQLIRTSDSLEVEATVNTTGGGDAIVLQPKDLLDARTGYLFRITAGVTDQSGATFIPFESHFSTGDFTNLKVDPRYRYAVQPAPLYNGTPISSLLFGPDGRLYATALDGIVRRWTLAADGTLTNLESWEGLQGRTMIGIAFQPGNPNVLWVTTDAPVYVQPAPDFTGTITRLTIDPSKPGFVATATDMVTGLPRSAKDHMTNSLAFGPDGALYVTQGSTTAAGRFRSHLVQPERASALGRAAATGPDQADRAHRRHHRVDGRRRAGQPLRPRRSGRPAHPLRRGHPQRLRPGLAQQRPPLRAGQRHRGRRKYAGLAHGRHSRSCLR